MASPPPSPPKPPPNPAIPITDLFYSLIDKADRKFSRLRDLPNFGRSNRNDGDFQKAFRIYTHLWKLQQEHRQRLVDAGLRRWEIGEIAARIAQLYYGQYQRTSDSAYLGEAFMFYEAILSREYFWDGGGGQGVEMGLVNKQLRFLARFLIVCLLMGRREMVARLTRMVKALADECRKNFQDSEFKEWKHVVQEIVRFLKFDSSFMNMRPLRYSFSYDEHPDSLAVVSSCYTRRGLVLSDAILSSYHHNEVKFTELTLDTFRMLQCLEWEPSGSFSTRSGADSGHTGINSTANLLKDIRDPSLPPNPRKVILYRLSVTRFLNVLATVCAELPPDGIMLIYLSASGGTGVDAPVTLGSEISLDSVDKSGGSFSNFSVPNPVTAPHSDTALPSSQKTETRQVSGDQAGLWFGSRGSGGSNYVYPCDLIPFTRRPLFLVIDSNKSYAFKDIHGAEKGETAVLLLSPTSRPPSMSAASESARYQNGSLFTMFLTSPVQAFCFLIGISGSSIDRDTFDKAEKILSQQLSAWEKSLVASIALNPVWVEVLGDPFLRRLLLRFIFCRAVLALYAPTHLQEEFIPSCLPHLPESVDPDSIISQSAIMQLTTFFNAAHHFSFSHGFSLSKTEA